MALLRFSWETSRSSCWPTSPEKSSRAGSRTPFAKLTPRVPARLFVRSWIAGGGAELVLGEEGITRSRTELVNPFRITTAAKSAPLSSWIWAWARVVTSRASRLETAEECVSPDTASWPRLTSPVGPRAPRSSFTMSTGSPCRWDAGSTIDPK